MVLVVALLAVLLMSALVAAVVSVSAAETVIAANFRAAQEGLAAADAAAERALGDLASTPDWNQVLNGVAQSTFVDGAPGGTRLLADGQSIDLSKTVNLANCGRPTACTTSAMALVTSERPWGPNNPHWQLYAYGKLEDVLPGSVIDFPYYAVVMVGDDPSEIDDDPLNDAPVGSPGSGIVALRVEVFGPRAVHRVLELIVGRASAGSIRLVAWHALS